MILYWDVIFHWCSTDTLFLYVRIAKLSLLGCYFFHLGPIKSFVKLKKIIKNQDRLRSLESYDPEQSQRSLKDLDRFGQVRS